MWETYKKLWKDPPFSTGKSTISMAIFNSYVKLPEGNHDSNLGIEAMTSGYIWMDDSGWFLSPEK